jgi:hypothetical protein
LAAPGIGYSIHPSRSHHFYASPTPGLELIVASGTLRADDSQYSTFLGFNCSWHAAWSSHPAFFICSVPYWFLALLLWYLKRRLLPRRPQTPGLCPTCTYDLRAHTPGQRCPECGTPIPAR